MSIEYKLVPLDGFHAAAMARYGVWTWFVSLDGEQYIPIDFDPRDEPFSRIGQEFVFGDSRPIPWTRRGLALYDVIFFVPTPKLYTPALCGFGES